MPCEHLSKFFWLEVRWGADPPTMTMVMLTAREGNRSFA